MKLLEQGPIPTAADLVSPLLAATSGDGPGLFVSARRLDAEGRHAEALDCCRRALQSWPDVRPVLQLALDLADRVGGDRQVLELVLRMLPRPPDDIRLKNSLAAMLCARNEHADALPLLRVAAPVLRHADNALWNYTSALMLTGGFAELLTLQPLLDTLASTVPPPYGPYVHLAVAKLAARFDLDRAAQDNQALRRSPLWLDMPTLQDRLRWAVVGGVPFSMIRISALEARLLLATDPLAVATLRPQEMEAVIESAWRLWFAEPMRGGGDALVGELSEGLLRAIEAADIIDLPTGGLVDQSPEQASFGAPLQRRLLDRRTAAAELTTLYTDDEVMRLLNESIPFLRPILFDLPFLGFVGWHTAMAEKLGRFYGIGQTAIHAVPMDREPAAEPHYPDSYRRVRSELVVPHRGAVFLVAAGVLGKLYCADIKAAGGVAFDIGAISGKWAGD